MRGSCCALVERNGVDSSTVRTVVEAFAAGDVKQALASTPPELGASLSVAGAPADWIEKIARDVVPSGVRHLLVTFADPFLVEAWTGTTVEGLPSLEEQLRLFAETVMPVFA